MCLLLNLWHHLPTQFVQVKTFMQNLSITFFVNFRKLSKCSKKQRFSRMTKLTILILVIVFEVQGLLEGGLSSTISLLSLNVFTHSKICILHIQPSHHHTALLTMNLFPWWTFPVFRPIQQYVEEIPSDTVVYR